MICPRTSSRIRFHTRPGCCCDPQDRRRQRPESDRTSDKRWSSECPACPKWTRRPGGTARPADDLQLLGCGIPHSSPPPCPIIFFEKTVLQRKFGDQLLQVAHRLAQAFNLARGRLAPGVAGEPLLARFQKLFRPAVIQTLGDALAAAQGGDALLAAQARHHDPDLSPQPYTACVSCAEYPEPFSPPGRSCSLISVSSSFPSVTTMSQKSSVMQLPQFVPKALTSDKQLYVLVVQHAFSGHVYSATQTIRDSNGILVYGRSGKGDMIKECVIHQDNQQRLRQ